MLRYDCRVSEHEDAVRSAGRRYTRTKATHAQARAEAVAAVVAALKAGKRPTDVTAWSPFTATYVRRLARSAGIEAR